MNDKLLRFGEKESYEVEDNPISLVISDVPSKVAYELLTTVLATGESISEEEIRRKVESRVNGNNVAISFPELTKMDLTKILNTRGEEYLTSFKPTHQHVFDRNGVCVCGLRRPVMEESIGPTTPEHQDLPSVEIDDDRCMESPSRPDYIENGGMEPEEGGKHL